MLEKAIVEDLNGYAINKSGLLINEKGAVVTRTGRRIFERFHLTREGDFPVLLNY